MRLRGQLISIPPISFIILIGFNPPILSLNQSEENNVDLHTYFTRISTVLDKIESEYSKIKIYYEYSIFNPSQKTINVSNGGCGPFYLNVTSSINFSIGPVFRCLAVNNNFSFGPGETLRNGSTSPIFSKDLFSSEITNESYIPLGRYRFEIRGNFYQPIKEENIHPTIMNVINFNGAPKILNNYYNLSNLYSDGKSSFLDNLSYPIQLLILGSSFFIIGALVAQIVRKKQN